MVCLLAGVAATTFHLRLCIVSCRLASAVQRTSRGMSSISLRHGRPSSRNHWLRLIGAKDAGMYALSSGLLRCCTQPLSLTVSHTNQDRASAAYHREQQHRGGSGTHPRGVPAPLHPRRSRCHPHAAPADSAHALSNAHQSIWLRRPASYEPSTEAWCSHRTHTTALRSSSFATCPTDLPSAAARSASFAYTSSITPTSFTGALDPTKPPT